MAIGKIFIGVIVITFKRLPTTTIRDYQLFLLSIVLSLIGARPEADARKQLLSDGEKGESNMLLPLACKKKKKKKKDRKSEYNRERYGEWRGSG